MNLTKMSTPYWVSIFRSRRRFFLSFFLFLFLLPLSFFQETTNGLSNRVCTEMTRTSDDKPTRRYPALGKRLFMIRHHRCGQTSRWIGFTVGNGVRSPRRASNRQSGPRDYCSHFPWISFFFLPRLAPLALTLSLFFFAFLLFRGIDRCVTHELQILRSFVVWGRCMDGDERREWKNFVIYNLEAF